MDSWVDGPVPAISSAAWLTYSAEFVTKLPQRDFDTVERTADKLRMAGHFGFTEREATTLIEEAAEVERILGPLTRPTWVDRHIWRL